MLSSQDLLRVETDLPILVALPVTDGGLQICETFMCRSVQAFIWGRFEENKICVGESEKL